MKKDGTVWAWGSNNFGQLGEGTSQNRSRPVQVRSMSGVSAFVCGAMHTLALKKDGTVWGWGWNVQGQLGDGTNEKRTMPVKMAFHIN